jgi:hypothetical protein
MGIQEYKGGEVGVNQNRVPAKSRVQHRVFLPHYTAIESLHAWCSRYTVTFRAPSASIRPHAPRSGYYYPGPPRRLGRCRPAAAQCERRARRTSMTRFQRKSRTCLTRAATSGLQCSTSAPRPTSCALSSGAVRRSPFCRGTTLSMHPR